MRNLVKSQGSGTRGHKPPRPQVFALIGCLFAWGLGCHSEAERLQAQSLYYLIQVQKILEANAGRTEQALAELDRFFEENRDQIRETNARGRELLNAMSPQEREDFVRRSRDKARPVKERIETLARTFPNPPLILNRLRDLM